MKKEIGLFVVLLVGLSLTCAKKKVVEPIPTPEEEAILVPPEEEAAKKEMEEAIAPLVLTRVNFDLDKYDISTEAAVILKENARQLKAHPDVNILIEGHCCELGTDEYNLALGERRAVAVRNYLTGLGISANRMTTVSFGEERPLDPRNLPLNRRCEFVRR